MFRGLSMILRGQQQSISPTAVLSAAAVEATRVFLLLLLLLPLRLREAVIAGPVNAWVSVRPRHATATTKAAALVLMLAIVVREHIHERRGARDQKIGIPRILGQFRILGPLLWIGDFPSAFLRRELLGTLLS